MPWEARYTSFVGHPHQEALAASLSSSALALSDRDGDGREPGLSNEIGVDNVTIAIWCALSPDLSSILLGSTCGHHFA
jgi:hypothetical protein